MKRATIKNILRAILLAAIAVLIARGVMWFRAPQDLEAKLFDVRQLALAPETTPSPAVVMIWLDEATMKGLAYRTPIPRSFLARLHEQIVAADPQLVAYDIFFKGASFPQADESLAQALKEHPAYAVVPRRPDGTVDMPDEIFRPGLAGVGLADLPFNPFDATVREASFSYRTDQGPVKTFAAELFSAATGEDASAVVNDKKRWPKLGFVVSTPYVDEERDIYIRFSGPPGKVGGADNAFKIYSAAMVAKGLVHKGWLKDKIVLVGASYEDLKDAFLTPYYAAFTGYARMNGVEIHANILSSLLTRQFYYLPSTWQVWVAIFIMALIIGAAAVKWSPWRATAVFAVVALAELFAAAISFRAAGLILPVVAPLVGATAAYGSGLGLKALTEGRQKRFIKGVFARYVPPAVVDRMTQQPELLKLGGEERIITSLFSDIASFTSMSERMTPTELVAFLNDYLGRMNAVLFEFGATLDKYEGDAIIAFFNAPLEVADHEACAVRAAVGMKRVSQDISRKWGDKLGREVITRIGINTGPAVVGNMGSEGRFDYTAIGDTINLASRLEGTNKFYNTIIMASEPTVSRLDGGIIVRPIDRVRVKGKTEPILLYEVMGEEGDVDITTMEQLVIPYREAFDLFGRRDIDAAKNKASKIIKSYPEDGPARELMRRIDKAMSEPEWDLVTDLLTK